MQELNIIFLANNVVKYDCKEHSFLQKFIDIIGSLGGKKKIIL